MDAEILDLVRRWLRHFGAIGAIASAAFGIYVELPFAEHAAAARIQALTQTIQSQWQRNLRQIQASERRVGAPRAGARRVHHR